MAERPKPPADPRPSSPAAGGGGGSAPSDAFDLWLRGALRQLIGPVADEPVPEALRRLAGGETPPAPPLPQPEGTAAVAACAADVMGRPRNQFRQGAPPRFGLYGNEQEGRHHDYQGDSGGRPGTIHGDGVCHRVI